MVALVLRCSITLSGTLEFTLVGFYAESVRLIIM
jgi:hypothetical protein